jgi:hypothetical protein
MLPEDALRLVRRLRTQGGGAAREELARRLALELNPRQQEELRRLLGDKHALERLMNSPEARELLRRLEDGGA